MLRYLAGACRQRRLTRFPQFGGRIAAGLRRCQSWAVLALEPGTNRLPSQSSQVLKRQIVGRAHFDLLRLRVLFEV